MLPAPPSSAPGSAALLTIREVAARLGVGRATAYKLCDRGELPYIRVSNSIRVTVADLKAFLQRRGSGA